MTVNISSNWEIHHLFCCNTEGKGPLSIATLILFTDEQMQIKFTTRYALQEDQENTMKQMPKPSISKSQQYLSMPQA